VKKFFIAFLFILFILSIIPINNIFADQGTTIIIKKFDNSNFPETIIYFSVYDSTGIPIKNLKEEDIEISENNQIITDFKLESLINSDFPSFISILIDNSGSMKGKPLEDAKSAAKIFINSLKESDEIKILTFNDKVNIIQDFTSDKDLLGKAIENIEIAGTKTVLNLAVYKAIQDLESKPQGQRFLILLTDGKDEDASINADDAIELAKKNKIPIFSIGFGDNFNDKSKKYDEEAFKALNRFSILTGGVFLVAAEEIDLKASFNKISDILSYQYKATYKSGLLKNGVEYKVVLSVKSLNETIKDSINSFTPKIRIEINISSFEDGQELSGSIQIKPDISIYPERFKPQDEISKVLYYLDSKSYLLKETSEYPYSFEFDTTLFDKGSHLLIVEVVDNLGNTYSFSKQFKIVGPVKNYNLYIYLGIGFFLLLLIVIFVIVFLKKRKTKKSGELNKLVTSSGKNDFLVSSNLTEQGLNLEDAYSDSEKAFDKTMIENKEVLLEDDFGSKTIIKSIKEIKPSAWLVEVKGAHQGEEYSIPPENSKDKRKITIGRSSYNDIVIDDETVSREHSYIIIEGNSYKIGDMGSTNGTFLNDKKVTSPKVLKDGDKITIGDSEFVFKVISLSKDLPIEKKSKPKK